MESNDWFAYGKLGIIGFRKTIQKGDYRITNRNPSFVPFISNMYDTLLWNDIVLYETSVRAYWMIVVGVIHAVALFFVIKWISVKRSSKYLGEQSTVQ